MSTHATIPVPLQKDHLTVGQLASYLGWSPRFIEGLVRGERFPGLEIEGRWHFRREDVVDWLEQKIQTLDSSHITELETNLESALHAEGVFRNPRRIDRLASRLPHKGIAIGLPLATKGDVLRALADLAENTGLLRDKEHLLASLVDRESLCSTAMPGGVAICHPRRPVPLAISRQFLCFLRTSSPVDSGAEDGEGTSMFFLLCAPDDRSHLHGLARLARLLHGGATESLAKVSNSEEAIAALAEAEAGIA